VSNALWHNSHVAVSGALATLSVVVALGAIVAYALLLQVAIVRNHPEGYVVIVFYRGYWVLDRDGVVRWFSVSRNFQVRPDPDDVRSP
jgi:hypothetical protein